MPSPRWIMAYVVGSTTITPHMKGNDPVKGVLKDILDIKNNPGIWKPTVASHIGKSEATAKRHLKQLVERSLIEYKGSDKTGGYYPQK